MSDVIVPPNALYRPLFPEDHDQGDPYILAPPPEAKTRFRFYVYTTGEDPVSGRAFPIFASDDLLRWQRLEDALPERDGALGEGIFPLAHKPYVRRVA